MLKVHSYKKLVLSLDNYKIPSVCLFDLKILVISDSTSKLHTSSLGKIRVRVTVQNIQEGDKKWSIQLKREKNVWRNEILLCTYTILSLSEEQRTNIFSQFKWYLLVLPPRDHHIRAGKIFCARTNTDYYFFVVGFPDADLVVLKKQI